MNNGFVHATDLALPEAPLGINFLICAAMQAHRGSLAAAFRAHGTRRDYRVMSVQLPIR
ncbi:MAG: hypothetical protein ACREP7_22215 [Lysobacter sp.]